MRRSLICKGIVIAAGVILLGVYYFMFNPMENQYALQCIFHRITGLQCAGCGSQRMIHALLHGNFADAFRANAFAFLSIPFLIFLIYIDIRRTRFSKLHRKVYSTSTIIIVACAIVLWSVVRNIPAVNVLITQ